MIGRANISVIAMSMLEALHALIAVFIAEFRAAVLSDANPVRTGVADRAE